MAASSPKPSSNIFKASPEPPLQTVSNPFAAQSTKLNPFTNNLASQSIPSFQSSAPQTQNKSTSHAKPVGFNPPAGPKQFSSPALKTFGAPAKPQQSNGNHGPRSQQPAKTPFGSKQAQTKAPLTRPPSEFGTRIKLQLAKDGIKRPEWPTDDNALRQKSVMDDLRHKHRAYREKARRSLMKADLVDDPDKRRRLDEALPFKGICEDMCPEWERIQRIVENGLWGPEGYEDGGVRVPEPDKMIKRLARSAAGQEAALPMDVRSPAACRRTLDYLIDELIAQDDRLPTYHHFAWDRTRAIRIDLSMQTPSMTPVEMKDEIYVLETIVRFHATSAHLLARSWFKYKDYSEQQEVEQLSKSLMTLKQRYKDCADMGVTCENEAEFLSYYIVFFGWDSALKETVESWGEEIYGTEDIQTAMCVVEAMQNTTMLHGPLKPESSTEIALNAASIFFSIVASPQISYTMACIAEIHFGPVRQTILKTIAKSYSRPKGAPKDITPDFLRRRLQFDTEDDAVAFAELHDLEFKQENGLRYLFIEPRTQIKRPRIPQAFSHDIVERKRNERPFPDVIHETIYEEPGATTGSGTHVAEDSLFVDTPAETSTPSEVAPVADSDLEDTETAAASVPSDGFAPARQPLFGNSPTTSVFSPHSTGLGATQPPSSMSGNIFGSSAQVTPTATTPQSNLFGRAPASTTTKPTHVPDAAKKVTFGETSVKYIESREDSGSAGNSSVSPGFFGFSNNTGSKPVPNIEEASTNSPSFFPTAAADLVPTSGNKESQSTLFGASAATGTDFKLPGSNETTASGLFGSAARGLSSPPSTHISRPNANVDNAFESGQSSTIFAPASSTQPVAGVNIFSSNAVTSAPASVPAIAAPQAAPLNTVQTTGLFTPTTTTGTFVPAPKTSNEEKLDNFARWLVCGDQGLMEDLEGWVVENLLRDVWDNFVKTEEERKRKEEDEKSWAEANKFRAYSLSVTYFYRWLEIFRKRRSVKRIRMEREKFRQWNSPDNVAKREAARKDVKRRKHDEVVNLLQEKAKGRAEGEDKSRQSTGSREDSVERALLGRGALNGTANPKEAARQLAMDEEETMADGQLPSEMLYRQESKRRERHGLPPLSRLQHPRIYKEGSKQAMLKAQLTGKDTSTISTTSFRNSTLSSSFRSSLGYNTSRVGKPKKSRVSDPYWRMKANGLVQMPNGEYLHESLALPMLREGKRFPGLGDYGLPPSASASPAASAMADSLFDESPPLMLEDGLRSRVSPSPSVTSNISSKRKRASYRLGDTEDDDLTAYRSERSASVHKRARSSGSIKNEPDLLAQMQGLLNDVQAVGKNLESR
ncbi:hypothetical protein TruAng_006870 [Truncatella angustata]|nr:hypothetical protein TruAng_006870 [Truncatella angustata]